METNPAWAYYTRLCEALIEKAPNDILPGKMMSAPALKYKGKVFVFFSKPDRMVFKLGKTFNLEAQECEGMKAFNPFKNKGPLAGWFEVPFQSKNDWEQFANEALMQLAGQ